MTSGSDEIGTIAWESAPPCDASKSPSSAALLPMLLASSCMACCCPVGLGGRGGRARIPDRGRGRLFTLVTPLFLGGSLVDSLVNSLVVLLVSTPSYELSPAARCPPDDADDDDAAAEDDPERAAAAAPNGISPGARLLL